MNFSVGAQNYHISPIVLLAIVAWVLFWKGWALWVAARKDHKAWFILILILNTIGILEMFYIFVFSKARTPSQKSVE